MSLKEELGRTRQEAVTIFVKALPRRLENHETVCRDDLPQERPKHIMEIWWLRQDWRAAVGYGRKRYKSRSRILTKQWSTLHSKKRNNCQKNRMIQILSCKAERSSGSQETRHFMEPEDA